MGFRLRKSIKIAPGIRLNVSKSGVGMSAGVKGARHAVHSSGRQTTMLGDPIFGVGYMKTTTTKKGGSRSGSQQEAAPPTARAKKPGWFAPKGEKALYKAIVESDNDALERVGTEFREYRSLAWSLAGLAFLSEHQVRSKRLLSDVFASSEDPVAHEFASKYPLTVRLQLQLAPGVEAELPLGRDAVGLSLAELRQDDGDVEGAIDVVEQLEPTSYAAVSLAELYSQARRHKDVVDLTEGVENEDDLTALVLVYRGIALRELGYPDASLEALKSALRARSRDSEIRNQAYSERASTYLALGKKAMARKDLERILAHDSSYEGVRERLDELASG